MSKHYYIIISLKEKVKNLEDKLNNFEKTVEKLSEEKKLLYELQNLKGNIIVICRVMPKIVEDGNKNTLHIKYFQSSIEIKKPENKAIERLNISLTPAQNQVVNFGII